MLIIARSRKLYTFLHNICYYTMCCFRNGHKSSFRHTDLVVCASEYYTNIPRQYWDSIILSLFYFNNLEQLPSITMSQSLLLITPMTTRVFIPCIAIPNLLLYGRFPCVEFISLVFIMFRR